MKNSDSEMLDLALTQAIEQYSEMEADEVCLAIANDWPEQIAVLLVEFFFKTTCGGNQMGMPAFRHIERDMGDGHYMALLCRCDHPWPFEGGL